MKVCKREKHPIADQLAYMNKKFPVQQRVMFSFLYNFKNLLTAWEFDNIRFAENTWTLSVGGPPVFQSTPNELTFKPIWLSDTRAQWEELTKDPK